MKGYTIKSVSEEGTYYLVKNWRKNKALWVKRDELKQEYLFTSLTRAENSLVSLLKVMPEYKEDNLTGYVIEDNGEMELALTIYPNLVMPDAINF